MMTHCTIAARDFDRKTLRLLAARRVTLLGLTSIPGACGSYAAPDACRAYQVADRGRGRILDHGQILRLATLEAL
jgi:hypothetical protein